MTAENIRRINLWSGPRNISTALMYSFAQREDTAVRDEPLYGYYLSHTDADTYHPMAAEVMASMEQDGEMVIASLLADQIKSVIFNKQMTHHLIGLPLDFLLKMDNVILIRDPWQMLPSYAKEIANPAMADVGYAANVDLWDHLTEVGKTPIVLDSGRLLEDPEAGLRKLCKALELPFFAEMLHWKAGERPEDGVWGKHWYGNVHRSTGFVAPALKDRAAFPERLKPLLDECLPLYEKLLRRAI